MFRVRNIRPFKNAVNPSASYNWDVGGVIETTRLILEPVTLPLVEAVFAGDRAALEDIVKAKVPEAWPGRVLVERAFRRGL